MGEVYFALADCSVISGQIANYLSYIPCELKTAY